MLADELDYVVGVDTHRDEHVLVAVAAPTGAVVARQAVRANARGYRETLRFAELYAPGARAWAIEGTGSYGAGLTRYLAGCAVRTTRSTRHERLARRSPARRSSCRDQVSGARRCGCCWSRVAAPSTCAAKHSDSSAASS